MRFGGFMYRAFVPLFSDGERIAISSAFSAISAIMLISLEESNGISTGKTRTESALLFKHHAIAPSTPPLSTSNGGLFGLFSVLTVVGWLVLRRLSL